MDRGVRSVRKLYLVCGNAGLKCTQTKQIDKLIKLISLIQWGEMNLDSFSFLKCRPLLSFTYQGASDVYKIEKLLR